MVVSHFAEESSMRWKTNQWRKIMLINHLNILWNYLLTNLAFLIKDLYANFWKSLINFNFYSLGTYIRFLCTLPFSKHLEDSGEDDKIVKWTFIFFPHYNSCFIYIESVVWDNCAFLQDNCVKSFQIIFKAPFIIYLNVLQSLEHLLFTVLKLADRIKNQQPRWIKIAKVRCNRLKHLYTSFSNE